MTTIDTADLENVTGAGLGMAITEGAKGAVLGAELGAGYFSYEGQKAYGRVGQGLGFVLGGAAGAAWGGIGGFTTGLRGQRLR